MLIFYLPNLTFGYFLLQVSGLVSRGFRPPSLSAIIVGDDKASQIYVGNKIKAAEKCGLKSEIIAKDSSVSQDELLDIIDGLKTNGKVRYLYSVM